MDITTIETVTVVQIENEQVDFSVHELGDLELSLVGGGQGDIHLG